MAMNNQTCVRGSGKNYRLMTFMIRTFRVMCKLMVMLFVGKDEMCLYGFSKNFEWEEPLRRPRLRQDYNIKMGVRSVKAADYSFGSAYGSAKRHHVL